MAKGDKQAVDTNINNLNNQINNGWQDTRNLWSQGINQVNPLFMGNATTASTGYGNMLGQNNGTGPNYAPTDKMISDLWYGSGVGGGIDQSQIDQLGQDTKGGFQNFATQGGLTPQFSNTFGGLTDQFGSYGNSINQGISDFQSIFNQPVDPQVQQQMLANGTFQNFIDTGGFSAGDLQNMRSRSMSPLLSTYSNAADELQRQRALSGGYGPNIAASQAQMARDLSNQASQQSINTEAQLAGMVQQGKEFGASGMSAAASNLGGLQLQGREAGATGVSQTALEAQRNVVAEQQAQTQVQQLDDQMKLAGLAGMTDIEKSQLQAELQNAQINEQAGAVNAELMAQKAMAQFGAEYNAPIIGGQQQLGALQGLTGLTGTLGSQLGNLYNLFQGSTQNQMSDLLNLNNQRISATQIPGDFSQAMGNIGSVIGAGGAIGNLFGLMGNKSPASGMNPGAGSAGYYGGGSFNPMGPSVGPNLYGNPYFQYQNFNDLYQSMGQ